MQTQTITLHPAPLRPARQLIVAALAGRPNSSPTTPRSANPPGHLRPAGHWLGPAAAGGRLRLLPRRRRAATWCASLSPAASQKDLTPTLPPYATHSLTMSRLGNRLAFLAHTLAESALYTLDVAPDQALGALRRLGPLPGRRGGGGWRRMAGCWW